MLKFSWYEVGDCGMFGVMIVDKKKQMFSIYQNMLHWEQYGFEILSYCDSEAKAVEYFCEYRYDLIISDVSLRQGDGISLLKQLKAYDVNCHVILCSYENDYSCMREAWRNGCMDYLMKNTLKSAQLIENLEMILSEKGVINKEQPPMDWQNELQRQLGLIRDHQKVSKEELQRLLVEQKMECLQGSYCLLGFRMDDVKQIFAQGRYPDRCALQQQMRDVLEEGLKGRCAFQILFSKMHSGIIVVSITDEKRLKELCNELIHRFKKKMDLNVSMLIADPCEGEELFYDTYVQIAWKNYERFYQGNGCVQHVKEHRYQPLETKQLSYKEAFLHQIGMDAIYQLKKITVQMMSEMRLKQYEPEDVIFYCRSILHAIEHQKLRYAKAGAPAILPQSETLFDQVETLQQLQEEFLNVLQQIEDWIKLYSEEGYSKTVTAVLAYVDEHLDEKITLEQIGKQLGRTSVHISRIFKKQTGEQLIQYINRRKMQEAAELMLQTDLKIKDVAAAVGMKDPFYFNKVFHHYYHMSPRQYRNR